VIWDGPLGQTELRLTMESACVLHCQAKNVKILQDLQVK
jgi:hypothetical protein